MFKWEGSGGRHTFMENGKKPAKKATFPVVTTIMYKWNRQCYFKSTKDGIIISSSTYILISMNIPDPFSPPVPFVHCGTIASRHLVGRWSRDYHMCRLVFLCFFPRHIAFISDQNLLTYKSVSKKINIRTPAKSCQKKHRISKHKQKNVFLK